MNVSDKKPNDLNPDFNSNSKLLKAYTEKLFTTIVFAENNPEQNRTQLEKISKIISTILTISSLSIINEKQKRDLTEEIQIINENLTTEKIKDKLIPLFNDFKDKNPKTSIVFQLIELEYIYCIAHGDKPPLIDSENFHSLIKPILDHLELDLKEMEIYRLKKKINDLAQRSLSPTGVLQALQELGSQLQG